MRRPVSIAHITMVLIIIMTAGVASAQPAPPAPPPPDAAIQNAPASDSLEIKKEIYYYESEALGRRDPFLSIITLRQSEETQEIVAPPLEKYDLSQMRLYAVVLTQKQQYAMILLPDGKHYTVRKGDRIGIHEGRVVSMTLGTVTVIEKIKNFKNQVIKKEVMLRLREEEEE